MISMATKGDWGSKLAALRLKARMSQPEAAVYLDMPVSTLRNWEQGRNLPHEYIRREVERQLKGKK
jgi:DNA-binding transcriptional regulator YiaG